MKICAVVTRSVSLSAKSGYDRIVDYLPEVDTVSRVRVVSRALGHRIQSRVCRGFAASRWYQPSSFAAEWTAAKRLRRTKPDILHYLWGDRDVGYLPWISRRLSPTTRLCATLHAIPRDGPLIWSVPRVFSRFDAIILVSDHQRRTLIELGAPPTSLYVIEHGVDTEYFHPGPPSTAPILRVLSVGAYLRDFGFLRQICEACRSNLKIAFEIIGPAASRPLFDGLPNVVYHHGLSDDDLALHYRSASCLLHTVTDATANNCVLEALASGLPVVAEAVGGVTEYVDSHCGFLRPRGDLAQIVAAINALANSTELRCVMGMAARRRAEQLSWPTVAAKTYRLYNKILGRAGAI